jgi:hypothetical protein
MLAGLGIWLFAPHDERGVRLPRPVAQLLDWSQKHGWGYTAFSGTAASAPSPDRPGPVNVEPASQASATSPVATPPPAVSLSAAQPSTAPGQPVVFTARLADSVPTVGDLSVRFYDGQTLLGTAVVRQEGRVRVAYLTATTLQVGNHDITAEIGGAAALGGQRSSTLRHRVGARSGR